MLIVTYLKKVKGWTLWLRQEGDFVELGNDLSMGSSY